MVNVDSSYKYDKNRRQIKQIFLINLLKINCHSNHAATGHLICTKMYFFFTHVTKMPKNNSPQLYSLFQKKPSSVFMRKMQTMHHTNG